MRPIGRGISRVASRAMRPHCRRKVRSTPFPPAAKTTFAPLHPKGTSAPTSWAWARLLSPPRGARRGPHICSYQKENAPRPVEKKKCLAALRCSGPPRDGGRRTGASADLALPSGTLGSSARSILPSRGGWCPGRRVARTHLTSFSFRAFRFATRCPGGRRGRCPHRPVAPTPARNRQRQRKSALVNAITAPMTSAPSATERQ